MQTDTVHFPSLLAAVLLLLGLPFGSGDVTNIDGVCDNIVNIFNTLNQAMPLHASLPSDPDQNGKTLATGTVTFDKAKRDCKLNCMSYVIKGSTIIRLFVASEIKIHLPNYMEVGNDVNLTASDATIELHYRVTQSAPNDEVILEPILTEVRDLGVVEMQTEREQEHYSDQAEDLLRPMLFTVADRFAKASLTFQITPSNYDPSEAAYDAFKTIFQAYMYNLHRDINNAKYY